MKLAAALVLIATPAFSDGGMNQTTCDLLFQKAVDARVAFTHYIYPGDETFIRSLRNEAVKVTDEGWCQLSADQLGLREIDGFRAVAWRASGLNDLEIDGGLPVAIGLRLSDVKFTPGMVPFDATVAVRRTPGGSFLIVEEVTFSSQNETFLAVTGVIDGAFFDNLNQAALSFGGLRLIQALVEADVTPERLRDFGVNERPEDVVEAIMGLGADQINTISRDDARSFLMDLPNAKGKLEAQFTSEFGLGWFQMTMAGWGSERRPAEAAEFLMSGSELRVNWQRQ